eukprot:SM000005S17265  [mRNA]  locus=s5:1143129:1146615:+ [translate_table: standard]
MLPATRPAAAGDGRPWALALPQPLGNAASVVLAAAALLAVAGLALSIAAVERPKSGTAGFRGNLRSPDCRIHDHVNRSVEADLGAVSADESRCSEIGLDVLKDGGNAVDAAVATAFCQGVVGPQASGIGGGAFMLVRMADGTTEAIDMREEAPAAASENMYKHDRTAAVSGGLASGTPGELAGLHVAWERHGRLPWARLVRPAAELAEGFEVRPFLAASLEASKDVILAFPSVRDVFAPGGRVLRTGDTCRWPKLAGKSMRQGAPGPAIFGPSHPVQRGLAETLRKVAKHGRKVLYEGELARRLAADIQAAGGIITEDDLASYRVHIREPLVTEEFGFTVLGVPPPSSGGPSIMQALKILSGFKMPLASLGSLGLHRTIEAFKHAFALRMSLGDPSFTNVTDVLADMLSDDFAAKMRATINDSTTLNYTEYGGKWNQLHDHGTSHFNVVDRDRNAVAMTSTINLGFGSKIVSKSTGILLNNEMDDFSIPGLPNVYGIPPAPANFIRPRKRPLSSMAPTIVLQGGQLRMVVGGSGGPFIITATAQVLLNYFALGLDPLSAVYAARIHHQLLPNVVFYENHTLLNGASVTLPQDVVTALQRRNHNTTAIPFGAVCQLIVHDLERPAEDTEGSPGLGRRKDTFYGKLIAVSDPRKDGAPAGY